MLDFSLFFHHFTGAGGAALFEQALRTLCVKVFTPGFSKLNARIFKMTLTIARYRVIINGNILQIRGNI